MKVKSCFYINSIIWHDNFNFAIHFSSEKINKDKTIYCVYFFGFYTFFDEEPKGEKIFAKFLNGEMI